MDYKKQITLTSWIWLTRQAKLTAMILMVFEHMIVSQFYP